MAAALAPPSLLPPQRASGLLGAGALALLAHALLIGALALGLNWRIHTPETVVAAELWSAIPQVAAPAAVAPPPEPAPAPRPAPKVPPPPAERRAEPTAAPRDAQIAIEKAEREKTAAQEREADQRRRQKALDDERKQAQRLAEQTKADQLKAERVQAERDRAAKLKEERHQKDLAAQREAKADEDKLARQREANLKRIIGQAGAEGGPAATGTAARDAAPSSAYAGRIKARIKPNIVLTSDVTGNPVTEVEVRCAADGTIVGRRVVKPSGDRTWDDTVLRAIDRTEILPRDVDGRVPSTIILVFPRRE